jgi:hypothetical protein
MGDSSVQGDRLKIKELAGSKVKEKLPFYLPQQPNG